MSNSLNNIFARRSVRKYKAKKIQQELVDKILEAAMASPSAANSRPCEFIVVEKEDLLKKNAEPLPHGKFLANAALGIIICGDINQVHRGELSYLLQDCSASIENTLIAISSLELGGCWIGVHPNEDRVKSLKTLFALPENIIPVAVVAIGYPDGKIPKPRTQYDANKIHRNCW